MRNSVPNSKLVIKKFSVFTRTVSEAANAPPNRKSGIRIHKATRVSARVTFFAAAFHCDLRWAFSMVRRHRLLNASGPAAFGSARSSSFFKQLIITLYPFLAYFIAIALPIPLEEPVTKIVFLFIKLPLSVTISIAQNGEK